MSTMPPGAIPLDDDLDLFGDDDEAVEEQKILSSWEDPEAASAASQAALVSDKPVMRDADPGVVDLPGGWVTSDGVLHKQAVVKELTGRDEERLARVDPTTNLPLFLQTMVTCGTESIGGEVPTKEALRGLLIGDREALILGIRIATYGNELPMELTCPKCQFHEKMELELNKDVPVKVMETPEIREYEVPLRNGGTAIIAPATAGIQDDVWNVKKTVAELRTATLERCVVSINGRGVNHATILNLGLADRGALLDRLADLQPGPDYEGVRLDCQGCGEEFPLSLNLTDLFRT